MSRSRPGGAFATLLGCETIRVNSLHGQGIDCAGERIVVEGVAEDGTIEAIRVAEAPGFALGVQWHAEYDPQKNPVNRKLFEAFGTALTEKRAAYRKAPRTHYSRRTGTVPRRFIDICLAIPPE